MEYVKLDGSVSTAELWSPGPAHQSVWALDDGRPVAIALKKDKATKELTPVEIDWEQPAPLPPRIPPAALKRAYDVLRRWWFSESRFYHTVRLETPADAEKPTDAEVKAARVVVQRHDRYEVLAREYREAHSASVSVADKRFADLWKAESDEHLPTPA